MWNSVNSKSKQKFKKAWRFSSVQPHPLGGRARYTYLIDHGGSGALEAADFRGEGVVEIGGDSGAGVEVLCGHGVGSFLGLQTLLNTGVSQYCVQDNHQ